jgi:hypothetical protein
MSSGVEFIFFTHSLLLIQPMKAKEKDPYHYPRSVRKFGAPKRVPWRTRQARVTIRKGPIERAQIKARRQARKEVSRQGIKSAEAAIFEEAKKLSAVRGDTPLQNYRMLLQRARITQSRRNVSAWNAYLRQEVKKRNDGM